MKPPQQNLQEADEDAELIQMVASVLKNNQAAMDIHLDLNIENPKDGGLIEAGEQQQLQQIEEVRGDNTKAIRVSASSLQIGQWIKKALHDDCIKAKFYFKKNKMALEVLMEDNRNTKFEIKFDQVSSLRPFYINTPNPHGVLEIQLNAKPKFFREKELKPNKHSNWEATDDFTDGQASSCMKHVLEFYPRGLEKLLQGIYNANTCLSSLINQPFPAEESPRFGHPQLPQIPLQVRHAYYNHVDGVDARWLASSSSSLLQDAEQFRSPIQPVQTNQHLSANDLFVSPTGQYCQSVAPPSSSFPEECQPFNLGQSPYLDDLVQTNPLPAAEFQYSTSAQVQNQICVESSIQEPSIFGVPPNEYSQFDFELVTNSNIGARLQVEDQLGRYHQLGDSTNDFGAQSYFPAFDGQFPPSSSIPQDQFVSFEVGSSLHAPLQTRQNAPNSGSPFVVQPSYSHVADELLLGQIPSTRTRYATNFVARDHNSLTLDNFPSQNCTPHPPMQNTYGKVPYWHH